MAHADHTITMNDRAGADKDDRGTRLGRYTLLERLGEGGMGIVYTAYDAELDRRVALKFLRGDRRKDDRARSRFLREARTLAQVAHRNVVTVFDVGTIDGKDFIAMEYVDGPTLRDYLETPRPVEEIVELFMQAGRGLAAAHSRGLVHRDFKPSNVLLTQSGEVRVTDFGLAVESATAIGHADTMSPEELSSVDDTMSGAGGVMGTPAYMAPEQYRGGVLDERTDQFAFAVALYEAVYGQRPFQGADLASLKQAVLEGQIRPAPKEREVPARVKRVIERGLKNAPAERFPSMSALLFALAPPAPPRRRLLVLAAGLVVVAAIVFSFLRGNQAVAALCDDAGNDATEAFSVVDQAALGLRLGAVDKVFARRVNEGLESYANQWRASATTVCQARYVDRRLSEEDALLQRQCLVERQQALSSTVDALINLPTSGYDRALATVRALPPIEDCADLAALRLGIRPPTDPTVRLRVEELRTQLADVRIKHRVGDLQDSEAQANRVVADARALDYKPLLAEAMLELGIIRRLEFRDDDSRAALREAELLAEESGHQPIRARAQVERLEAETLFSFDHERGRETARRARVAAEQSPDKTRLIASIDRALARMTLEELKFEETRALLEQALAGFRASEGDVEADVAETLILLGDAFHALNRDKDALESFEEALTIRRASLPGNRSLFEIKLTVDREIVDPEDDHPAIAEILEKMAHIYEIMNDEETANELYADAVRIWARPRGQAYLESRSPPPDTVPARRIAGRVLDPAGAPVAGAVVLIGSRILMGSRQLETGIDGSEVRRTGLRRAVTDNTGRFEFADVVSKEIRLAAEHPDFGRSSVMPLPDAVASELTVRLQPFGRLEVKVLGLENARHAVVFAGNATSENAFISGAVVCARPDGRAVFERIAAGDYQLFVQLGHNLTPLRLVSTPLHIAPATTNHAVLDVAASFGHAEISAKVVETHDIPVRHVIAVLFPGTVKLSNVEQLNDYVSGNKSNSNVTMLQSPLPLRFENILPGKYSVCAVAFRTEGKDPDNLRTAERDPKRVPVSCETVTVTETDAQQVTISVTFPEALR